LWTLNISETARDRAIVTVERQQEVVCAESHGDNDIDGPVTQCYLKSNISKGTKNTKRKSYVIYRMVYHFQRLWVTADPDFKVTTFLKSNIGKPARLKDKVTIAQEETIPNVWNGTMFGDLD